MAETICTTAQFAGSLPFTYTPFAAVAFASLAIPPATLAASLFCAASVIALARSMWLALGLAQAGETQRWSRRQATAVLTFLALAAEPGLANLSYGQINLLLMWCVLEDLCRSGRRPAAGALTGIATSIKLVPGIFLLFHLIIGRRRSFWAGVLVLLATIAVSTWLIPASAAAFWSGAGLDDSRIGSAAFISNQSLNGVLWRTLGPGSHTLIWAPLATVVVVVALATARRLWHRGDRLSAISAVALGGLLASPISWSHHWVWTAVVVIALIQPTQDRHRQLVPRALAILWVASSMTRLIWLFPHGGDLEYHAAWWQLLPANIYSIAGLTTLIWLCHCAFSATPPSAWVAERQTLSRQSDAVPVIGPARARVDRVT